MLDGNATTRARAVGLFLLSRKLTASGFLGRHLDGDSIESEAEKTQVLQQDTARRQRIGSRVRQTLIMDGARLGRTEKHDAQLRIDQDEIFHRVTFFLAAIMAFLFIRIFGALDASFSSVMAKRGG